MKRLKDIVKLNPEPARGKSGIDPLDPWGAKAGIAEASEQQLLNQFLKSRGINPNFVSTDTKISHSKSGQFLQWKQNHEHNFREENILEATDEKDMICFDIPLLIRVLEFTREDMKTDIELHNMVERLINMRETYPLTMKQYDAITQKLVKENHIAIAMGKMLDDESGMVLTQIEELERGCAMIRSYIGKDYEKQLPAWVQAKITLATDYMSTVGNYLISKNEKVNEEAKLDEMINEVLSKDASAGDWIHDFIHSDNPKFAGKSKKERQKQALAAYYAKQNEEVEQIDEVNYDTVKSLYAKRREMRDEPSKKSKEVKVKNVGTSISRLAGYKSTQKQPFDKIDKGTHYELKPKNEEVEQIVEISKKTVKSWLGQQKPIPEKKPGEQRKAFNVRIKKRSKSWDGAIDRLTDRKPTSEEVNFQEDKKTALDRFRAASVDREKKHNDIEKKRQEKLHQDPSKVTVPVANTNKDDMTSAIDRLEKHLNKESVQSERTKSARIIKSLYKAKGVKEETYDWEKDDKAQSYGKKPKIDKPDGQDNMDQKKPQARAVMVGGTTLTGIKRDTVEIDPLMKNVVPGQMAFDRLSKK